MPADTTNILLISFSGSGGRVLDEALSRCGVTRVVRERADLGFLPSDHNAHRPSGRINALHTAWHDGDSPSSRIALVRDAEAVWHAHHRPPHSAFFRAYRAYVEQLAAADLKVYRYEDLIAAPETVLRAIAGACGIAFMPDVLDAPLLRAAGRTPKTRAWLPTPIRKELDTNLDLDAARQHFGYGERTIASTFGDSAKADGMPFRLPTERYEASRRRPDRDTTSGTTASGRRAA